jgi:hypothetical protein
LRVVIIKGFEQSYSTSQGKESKHHANCQVTIEKKIRGKQCQFGGKEIGGVEHVVIGDVVLVVVVIEIIEQRAFPGKFLSSKREPEIRRIILDSRAKILHGLVIQAGVASFKINFGEECKGEYTDHLKIKGPVIKHFNALVFIIARLGPYDKKTDKEAHRKDSDIKRRKETCQ